MRAVRALTESLGGSHASTLIGGGWSAPDRAAFYNVALSRYLDFMDSYLAAGETNHPSDNLGAVLAAAESVGGSGRDFLTALACAYRSTPVSPTWHPYEPRDSTTPLRGRTRWLREPPGRCG